MHKEEIDYFIRLVPLFSGLSSQERSTLANIVIVRSFGRGQTIVYEQDSQNLSFFIIASGTVHVAVFTAEGKQTTLATLRKGDFFGEMALLDGEPRSASVIAEGECRLLILQRRDFLAILNKYPSIAIRMLAELSRRLRKANKHIRTLSLMSVYGRVAEVLIHLGKEIGTKTGDMTVIASRPTHQAIADRAGTSRETVSRILSQLQKKGYISIDRKRLVILNESKLCD